MSLPALPSAPRPVAAKVPTSIPQTPQEVSHQADVLMLGLLLASCVLSLPIAWAYSDIVIALQWGTALALAGVLLFALARGSAWSRYGLTALLALTVALHIQVSLGTVEFHFGVFVVLALIMVYRDWRVVLANAVLFAVHHLLFDRLQAWGFGMYCMPQPDFARIWLHAAYVIVQTAAEVFILIRMSQAFRQGAELQALTEAVQRDGRFNLDVRHVRIHTALGERLQTLFMHLYGTVKTVRDSVNQVQTAGSEIADGSLDLSARTEAASSALAATMASASQVLHAVEHTRDLASQADQLTSSAAQVSQAGASVVQQVVDSMHGIHTQAQQIAEIVTVVDGLAFQTNLLALNAAVEAARAGEQGRGFAVVAGEVRSLAQRSTEAAKEIQALIGASTSSVGQGARLMQEARQGIEKAVESVTNVNDLIGQIGVAADEQSKGIAQLNVAVNHLDRDTQENAALAEQSAASARAMSQNAGLLGRTLAVFRLQ